MDELAALQGGGNVFVEPHHDARGRIAVIHNMNKAAYRFRDVRRRRQLPRKELDARCGCVACWLFASVSAGGVGCGTEVPRTLFFVWIALPCL